MHWGYKKADKSNSGNNLDAGNKPTYHVKVKFE